jgi:hypothetical protein
MYVSLGHLTISNQARPFSSGKVEKFKAMACPAIHEVTNQAIVQFRQIDNIIGSTRYVTLFHDGLYDAS